MSEFKTFYYNLKTGKLPKDFGGLTFVLLADLHNRTYGPGNERLLAAIDRERPDAVLVAGDMLISHTESSFAPALELFQNLRKRRYPVFYGNGNHEYRMRIYPQVYGDMYREYAGALRECGVCLLENEKTVFEKEGVRLNIYGFELDRKYYKKLHREQFRREELTEALGEPDPDRYNVLLAHNPVYFDEYAGWGADLTLCGHFHGGTVRIPGLGGLMTPQFQFFRKCCGGIHRLAGKVMIVSRGLGTHSVNVRLNNKPELVVIRLKAAVYRK